MTTESEIEASDVGHSIDGFVGLDDSNVVRARSAKVGDKIIHKEIGALLEVDMIGPGDVYYRIDWGDEKGTTLRRRSFTNWQAVITRLAKTGQGMFRPA